MAWQLGRRWWVLLLASICALATSQVLARVVGEVEFSQGAGFAQLPGQAPRTLGKGLPLQEGDRLTTASTSTAIVRLEDGTRMTLRPNSEVVLKAVQYRQQVVADTMVLQLLRGGLRAFTGGISKSGPDAARVETAVATVGIRGTDFDARLCALDCAGSAQGQQAASRPNAERASARLIASRGLVEAVEPQGARRRLAEGAAIYPGERIELAEGAQGVLVFRDDTRLTLGPRARLLVDDFIYDAANPREGRFAVSVLRGTVRALTGLLAKANPQQVRFSTATATVGVRGTGLDIVCVGACAGEERGPDDVDLRLCTWQGEIVAMPVDGAPPQVLPLGECMAWGADGARRVPVSVPEGLPRPDEVEVPPRLFGSEPLPEAGQGLYVYVRAGHIALRSEGGELHLGRGELGFANTTTTLRPADVFRFIDGDRTPLPTSSNPGLARVFDTSGLATQNNMCR